MEKINNKLNLCVFFSFPGQRDLVKNYLSGQFVDGIENLIHYCVLNDIGKSDLEYFTSKRRTNVCIFFTFLFYKLIFFY